MARKVRLGDYTWDAGMSLAYPTAGALMAWSLAGAISTGIAKTPLPSNVADVSLIVGSVAGALFSVGSSIQADQAGGSNLAQSLMRKALPLTVVAATAFMIYSSDDTRIPEQNAATQHMPLPIVEDPQVAAFIAHYAPPFEKSTQKILDMPTGP